MNDEPSGRLAAARQMFGFGRKMWTAVLALTAFAGLLIVYSYGFLEVGLDHIRIEGPPLPDLPDGSSADVDTSQA
ncbi:hypothetical protein LPJ58_006366, partial [Coemansia sp. RSA 1591]